MDGSHGWRSERQVGVRLLVLGLAGAVVALFLTWRLRDALLLVFASVVAAVILDGGVRLICRVVPVPRPGALVLMALLLLALFGVPMWLIGEEIRNQVGNVVTRLPDAIRGLEGLLGVTLLPPASAEGVGEKLADVSSTIQSLTGSVVAMGGTLAGALSATVVVVVGAFFLAADPGLYREGVMLLFPRERQAQVLDAMEAAAAALRLWLGAQLVAMTVVGIVVGLGAWWIGLPAPLAIGLFAALAEFIPTIGAFVGAVPALLLALSLGREAVVWTVLLFVVVQQVESNLVAPIVQRQMAQIPPALLLFALVAAGVLFGLPGVIVAAPLTVVLLVMVKKLYVRQVLGEETAVPGETDNETNTEQLGRGPGGQP